MMDIDVVYTWVNGGDPAHQAELASLRQRRDELEAERDLLAGEYEALVARSSTAAAERDSAQAQRHAALAERDGRRFLYSPVLARDEWLGSESISLIDRLFGGGLAPLVAQFASRRKLSKADVAALKALLKDQGRD